MTLTTAVKRWVLLRHEVGHSTVEQGLHRHDLWVGKLRLLRVEGIWVVVMGLLLLLLLRLVLLHVTSVLRVLHPVAGVAQTGGQRW